MPMFNMHDAKTQLSDLVARAEAGEEIVIARRNMPAVRLVPVMAPDTFRYDVDRAQEAAKSGFGERAAADIDWSGLEKAVKAGKEFTIMQDGSPVMKLEPLSEKAPRRPGLLAHLPPIPDSFFFDPLPEEELLAWEGAYSFDPDKAE